MCGGGKQQEVTQKVEVDPYLRRFLYGGTQANPRGGFGAVSAPPAPTVETVDNTGEFAAGGYVTPQMGIASLNQGRMPTVNNGMTPNLSDPMTAATLAMAVQRPQTMYGAPMAPPPVTPSPMPGYVRGGYVEGPGTGRSDSIQAQIYQNGQPVQEARLSDGEFVMTERAVRGAGGGDRDAGAARMYEMMRRFERGGMT